MTLTNTGYAHVTAHTVQVIDQFKEDLRVKLAQDKAPYWRQHYQACAHGAMTVWMSASAGLLDPKDVDAIDKMISSFTEE